MGFYKQNRTIETVNLVEMRFYKQNRKTENGVLYTKQRDRKCPTGPREGTNTFNEPLYFKFKSILEVPYVKEKGKAG